MGKKKKGSEETVADLERQEPAEEAEVAAEGGRQEEREEDPAAALEKVREEAREARDQLLRMAADFENQKKRLQREKEAALKYAEENLIREILPSIDNLERAMNQDRNSDDFGKQLLEGVKLTRAGLLESLAKVGLKPLDSVGEPFDPNYHEALAMESSREVPEQRVKAEFEKGYMFKDRLLRAAKVIVSKGDVEE
ncbi:MAG: nucleotide exchange factor GrpE [Desulfurivibrionaceae bacterium]|nr:nucleotide exchange factor GrpE [Desulfobulbales bacterium]MDT8335789.1 nucleotide exchange factor GrpE [Desulfurivibrionaceae bacterium]